jgi:hypothetical protein
MCILVTVLKISHMKKLISAILLLSFTGFISTGQNLVSNAGFENFSSLPTSYGQIPLAVGWNNCGGSADPDYFHTSGASLPFFGTIGPNTGDAMAGICTYHSSNSNFREYISTQLTSPLTPGQPYQVSFYIASGSDGGYSEASDHFSVAFSSTPLIQNGGNPITYIPQLELPGAICEPVWQQYTLIYTPTNPEQYITIGNFQNDANTAHVPCHAGTILATYYFIDDVVVEALTGINENESEFHSFIYQLTSDVINFQTTVQALLLNPELRIYDSAGKEVLRNKITSETTAIDTMIPGIYFYHLLSDEKIISKGKFMIR